MAVGLIVVCPECGKSYDDGKGYHRAECDRGESKKAEKKALDKFNSLPIDKRLEILFLRITKLESKFNNIPFDGPIS